MAYDLKREDEVKEYIENLGIEYRFGCYKEKKPEVCQLLGDYLEAIKKDFPTAAKVYRSNCLERNHGASCTKIGNYSFLGKGLDKSDPVEALSFYEKGCELNDRASCLHAGVLLTSTAPNPTPKRDMPKGFNYLKKSCDANEDRACHFLSGMYISGIPKNVADFNPHDLTKNKNIDYLIKPDMKQAFQFARKACEFGNVYACANVSMMYNKGEGVEKNTELAEKFKEITLALQKAHETAKEVKFQQGLEDK